MNIKILIPIAGLLFYRCATTPSEHYSSLLSISESNIISTLKDAIHGTEAENLVIGDTVRTALTKSDPVILLDKTKTFRTNYKLYRFHASENEVYTIEIISTCDSTHADKIILFPIFIFMDKEGIVLSQNNMALFETISSNLSKAFSICGYQDVYIENAGDYYLIVASDNSAHSGNTITTMHNKQTLKYKLQGVSGKRHPWGSYRLSIRKKE